MLNILPVLSTAVVALFAWQVLARWLSRRDRTHLLIWGIGLILYGIGSFTEAIYAWAGWREGWGEWNFRFWYLCGAVLVAAWLGQGTVFLLWKRAARPSFIALLAGSAFAAYWVFSAPIDPAPLVAGAAELTGKGVFPLRVRLITPFFNIYGVVTLAGGALWSASVYWRTRRHPNRMVGNILIAAGALSPALGGALNRFGFPGLYVGELVGALLMFAGFLAVSAKAVTAASAVASTQQPAG